MGEPHAGCSCIATVEPRAFQNPSYGGLHTIGTETVTAHPGDWTVVYTYDENSVDAVTHRRTLVFVTHCRYL